MKAIAQGPTSEVARVFGQVCPMYYSMISVASWCRDLPAVMPVVPHHGHIEFLRSVFLIEVFPVLLILTPPTSRTAL